MGFITVLLIFVVLYLFWQVHALGKRLRADEAARAELERQLAYLVAHAIRQSTSPEQSAASSPLTEVPVAAAPAAPPEPAPAPLPASAQVALRPSPSSAAATPSTALWAPSSESPGGRAASTAQRTSRGPGVTVQLLERFGLSPTKDGELASRAAIESWLEGRMLAVVGGIALTLGAAFFLSLAFSRGWITEPMRVLIGLAGGAVAIGIGEIAFVKLKGIVGHVLVAVGLAILSLALIAATRLFGLIPPEAGVAAALVTAIVAAFIAIRHDSELVAGFGLVSVLAAPPLLGASPTFLTIMFLAAALIGTTAIALYRTWVWLPPLAFLLAAPQVASSVTGADSVLASLATIAGFWLLNTIAAGGEEIRHPTDRLRPTTVSLLLASAAFTLWAGTTALDGTFAAWRGAFVALLAVAHLGLGLGLLARHGDRHPFGLVVSAVGVASVTLAVPIQFGAGWVPVAWAAEAVALCWLAVRFRHPFAASASLALGAISLVHLLALEYPGDLMAAGLDRTWPFVGPEGLTFAFMMAAAAIAGAIVPSAWVRAWLSIVALLTTTYVLPFETSDTGLVIAWSGLTVATMVAWRYVVARQLPRAFAERDLSSLRLPVWARPLEEAVLDLSWFARPSFAWTVPLPIAAAIAHLAAFEYPMTTIGSLVISGIPYASLEGLAAAAVVVGLLLAGGLGSQAARLAGVGVALMVTMYTLPFEVIWPLVMPALGVATVAGVALVRRATVVPLGLPGRATVDHVGERVPYLAAAFGLAAMLVDALWWAAPSDFLLAVAGERPPAGVPFVDELTVGLVALALTIAAAGWAWGSLSARTTGLIGAGIAIAWLLPFELRPAYAVAGWAAIAAGGFGLARWQPASRIPAGAASLGLLGFGALVTFVVVAPPSRLVVDPTTVVGGLPILTDAAVALLSLAAACAVGVRLHRTDPLSLPGAIAAALLLLYAISVGVVDVFQQQVGTRALEDLQREAQLALSLTWSILGGIAFVVGLRTRLAPVRRAGLALLGLATAKVFVVDLASLDVAYRVLSLVGLGTLLLVSALVYARQQQREAPTETEA